MLLSITHWFPIITKCPENDLPDFLFATVEFKGWEELYEIRKEMKRDFFMKRIYMEDVAQKIFERFPQASACEVRLAFNKHKVRLTRDV